LKGKGVDELKAQDVAHAQQYPLIECHQWHLRTDQERQARLKQHAALIKAG